MSVKWGLARLRDGFLPRMERHGKDPPGPWYPPLLQGPWIQKKVERPSQQKLAAIDPYDL